jgi:hypothetical protein
MREEPEKFTWQNTNEENIEGKWYCFSNNIQLLMDKYISKTQPNPTRRRGQCT